MNNFNEKSARNLAYYLLEEDAKIFKQFLPEIKNFDSITFENMFSAEKYYDYKFSNKNHFNLLLYKFENFNFLLFEFYDDNNTYQYIKELWQKYICLESLRNKSKDEIGNFLSKKNIDYKIWPEQFKYFIFRTLHGINRTTLYNNKDEIQYFYKRLDLFFNNNFYTSKYCHKNIDENQLVYRKNNLECNFMNFIFNTSSLNNFCIYEQDTEKTKMFFDIINRVINYKREVLDLIGDIKYNLEDNKKRNNNIFNSVIDGIGNIFSLNILKENSLSTKIEKLENILKDTKNIDHKIDEVINIIQEYKEAKPSYFDD